jgi:WD40 repeat protein
VIYTLNFTPDSKYCITGSRDKKLKIWDLNKLALAHEAKLDDSITAVSTI